MTVIVCSALVVVRAQAQRITLEECQTKAAQNYPLIQQYQLLNIAENYTLDKISKVYMPQASLNGQATYQSDVTKISLEKELPITLNINDYFPTMKKDQYKVYGEVQQLLWDGDRSKAQSQLTKASNNVDKEKITVNLYAIKGKINDLYFGVLAVEEQKKQLTIYRSNFQANANMIKSMLKNGVAMASDMDQIEVEFLNIDQKNTELESAKDAYLNMLSIFIGEKISKQTELIIPADIQSLNTDIQRPELSLFEKERNLYASQEFSIKAKNKPTVGLFVQGGYGRPALNMLNPDFKFYAIGGVKFSWDFGNLYTKKTELNEIKNNQKMVDVQEKTFLFNTNLEMQQISPEIQKYKDLMQKDVQIMELRERVKTTSQSKYKNGVYHINDLISDTNAENLARQAKAQHYIQYLNSIYNYQFKQGK